MEPNTGAFEISPEKMDFRAYSISWNLTKRCNLNCDHCYLDADFRGGFRTDELNTEQCFTVIDQIAEVNPNAFLILTGGEPLLRPDIYKIIRYAADKKFMVVLGTNGTLINRENAIKDQGSRRARRGHQHRLHGAAQAQQVPRPSIRPGKNRWRRSTS